MGKILTLFKKQAAVDDRTLRDYLAKDYTAAVLAIPAAGAAITRIVHNHAVALKIREDAEFPMPDWAAVAETWFDSSEAVQAFLSHTSQQQWHNRHSGMFNTVVHLPCRELEIWNNGVERPSIKMMAFFHPSAAMTREQSQDYWTNRHVDVGARLSDPQRFAPRYVQNHVLADYHTADSRHDFAGCPELWFYSPESAVALFTEPGDENLAKLNEDEAIFSDRSSTVMMVTDEVPVYP
ncbi:MAG: hypothetical protein VR73_11050 [Gammaproteobacteria bacterium BRH_c0]|nr:MAG: hypothetical protein VR73_11050 [Gammaproteobacteria bacterium BRH_c0]